MPYPTNSVWEWIDSMAGPVPSSEPVRTLDPPRTVATASASIGYTLDDYEKHLRDTFRAAPKLHGWFSRKQAAISGKAVYLTPGGYMVEVSLVSRTKEHGTNWGDIEYVGEVEKWLADGGFADMQELQVRRAEERIVEILTSVGAMTDAIFRALNEQSITEKGELGVGDHAMCDWNAKFDRVAAIMQRLEPGKAKEARELAEKVLQYLKREKS